MAIAKFSVIRHQPYHNRTEHVNIGLVLYFEDGTVKVRMASNLRKLKAFDPSADIDSVRNQESALEELLNETPAERRNLIAATLGPWRLEGTTGSLSYHSADDLERAINWALFQTCEPSTAKRFTDRRHPSRLLLDLKKTFSMYGWLSSDPNQISKKLIVHRYPLFPDEGLYADFAIRNKTLNVFETLDMRYSSNPSAKRTEGLAKAMVLSAAKAEPDINANCIVAGSSTDYAKETTKLLNRISSRFYVYESSADMNELLRDMGEATGKPMLELPV